MYHPILHCLIRRLKLQISPTHHFTPLMEELQITSSHHENQAAAVAPLPVEAGGHRSNVDTSRPFRSVKEAVAILAQKISLEPTSSRNPLPLPKKEESFHFHSPNPITLTDIEPISSKHSSPSPRVSSCSCDTTLSNTLKRLEAELEETKAELKLLKKRESETEVALASLNAELHRNMSRLARAEATAARKAADSFRPALSLDHTSVTMREDEIKKGELIGRVGSTTTTSPPPILAKVLSVGDEEKLFHRRHKERKWMKKKPIIPLLGELFSKNKVSSTSLHNPLYVSPPLHFN